MKKLTFVLASTTMLITAPAVAADLGRPIYKAPVVAAVPYFNWTGCYIGAHVGGSWGRKRWVDLGDDNSDDTDYRTSGVLGGGQVGCDYQFGAFVFGGEGSYSGAGIRGKGPLPFEIEPTTFESRIDWIATATGRLGYTWDRTLLYVKGGGAWVGERHTMDELGFLAQTIRSTRSGWLVGGGVEHAFTPNWSVKVEYNYMDFGRQAHLFDLLADDPAEVRQQMHVIKLGINYRFGWGAPLVASY